MDKTVNAEKAHHTIIDRAEAGIAVVVRGDNTWGAYIMKDQTDFHYIVAEGSPLPGNIAYFLFPEVWQRLPHLEYKP